MQAKLACKYCNATETGGGEFFYGLDNRQHKVCWKTECRAAFIKEAARIDFRNRMKLKMAGKCFYEDQFGFCEAPVIKGEALCEEHLMCRCVVCGLQAVRICKFKGYRDCFKPLCSSHTHHHPYP